MKRFENILYVSEQGVDEKAAVERAVALARNNQARLTIMHASGEPRLGPLSEKHTRQEVESLLRERELERLESLAAPYRAHTDIHLTVRFGIPFIEVVRDVIRNGRDLAIKAASGDIGVRDRLFGSTDMHLLRKCPCPVWIMRPDDSFNYQRILAAVDFDPWESSEVVEEMLNRRILELAGSLALSDFAELHLVHAWDAPAEILTRLWGDESTEENTVSYVASERRLHRAGLERFAAALRGWIGDEGYDYLSPQLHLPRGNPREAIPALARELKTDLLVMGTLARTGITGFIIGNTAESILHRIGCSVLAVKPEGFVSPVAPDE
ncbi:MAG: universal stress protein [Gammaproteobacteria bacterium]|nr:universal stress protein [Gammaproteobacteria bacterium]